MRSDAEKGNHIITVASEHKAVLDTCKHLEKLGRRVTYLPLQPGEEDSGEVSVYTTADYFWAPDRYNPNQSFQWGVAKHLGK